MAIFLAGLGVTHSIRERRVSEIKIYSAARANWFLAMRSPHSRFTFNPPHHLEADIQAFPFKWPKPQALLLSLTCSESFKGA